MEEGSTLRRGRGRFCQFGGGEFGGKPKRWTSSTTTATTTTTTTTTAAAISAIDITAATTI